MEEFNNHLKELIEEYDDGETETASQAPQSRHVRIENKNFFFSCKKNAQGRYITISEVKGNFRNSILIPESGWDDFRDVFDEYTKQCKDQEWIKNKPDNRQKTTLLLFPFKLSFSLSLSLLPPLLLQKERCENWKPAKVVLLESYNITITDRVTSSMY